MRFAYFRAAARSAGVPEMWIDDAAQDIAIRCWKAGDDTVRIVTLASYSAAAKYGTFRRRPDKRADTVRPVVSTLCEHVEAPADAYSVAVEMIDFSRAVAALPPRQAEAVRRRCAGVPLGATLRRYLSDALPKLRTALAAQQRLPFEVQQSSPPARRASLSLPYFLPLALPPPPFAWPSLVEGFERTCAFTFVPSAFS